ncbi:MAG: hypothetical protein PVJ50_10055, partial [Desulfobacterales bacterium]
MTGGQPWPFTLGKDTNFGHRFPILNCGEGDISTSRAKIRVSAGFKFRLLFPGVNVQLSHFRHNCVFYRIKLTTIKPYTFATETFPYGDFIDCALSHMLCIVGISLHPPYVDAYLLLFYQQAQVLDLCNRVVFMGDIAVKLLLLCF